MFRKLMIVIDSGSEISLPLKLRWGLRFNSKILTSLISNNILEILVHYNAIEYFFFLRKSLLRAVDTETFLVRLMNHSSD
jgi:hypothetical protein